MTMSWRWLVINECAKWSADCSAKGMGAQKRRKCDAETLNYRVAVE